MNMFKKAQAARPKGASPSPQAPAPESDLAKNPAPSDNRVYNILAYAIDRAGVAVPSEPIRTRNYTLVFEPYNTVRRFDEYDAVILFQGIFEQFETKSNYYSGRYLVHSHDRDELDKRHKELQLLLNKGGFACFILHRPFIDRNESADISDTDLCKRELNYSSFYRNDSSDRAAHVRPCRGELTRFCELYGAACTSFDCYNENVVVTPLVKVGNKLVGLALAGNEFFIPTLMPEDHRVGEYFQTLSDALVGIRNKLVVDIPKWVDAFRFEREDEASVRVETLNQEVSRLSDEIETFRSFKRVLVTDGDALVDAVGRVFKDGFGFRVDATDEKREDVKLLDSEGKSLVFAEIKGTNTGVKREYINQADSHRERAGLPADFPTILVVNTHIKNSRTVEEKDQPVPGEQILHAKRIGVLVVRTLDLLRLLRVMKRGAIESAQVMKILQSGGGWLRCDDAKMEVVTQ